MKCGHMERMTEIAVDRLRHMVAGTVVMRSSVSRRNDAARTMENR